MKYFALTFVAIFICTVTPTYAVDMWHSNTLWAGQGQCSAVFSFDSAIDEMKDLQVSVTAIDKSGKKVASDVLSIKQIGDSEANRYATAFLEGDVCADDLTIVVNKATAIIDGKKVDLLKTKQLSLRDFKPFKIRLNK